MILFQITQVVLIEYFQTFDGGSAVTIFAPEDSETKKLNATLRERTQSRMGKSAGEKAQVVADDPGGCVRGFMSAAVGR